MKIHSFTDLEIWRLGIDLSISIYTLTKKSEFKKDYGLVDQIRRATVSVSSNIAEGFERNNNNEFIQYLRIAKGSTGEARTQLLIAFRLDYLTKEEYNKLEAELYTLSSKIGNFLVYLKKKQKEKDFSTR